MSTANAKSGLALVFGKLGKFQKELKLQEEVLETQGRCLHCLGTGHASVAATENNIGNVYSSLVH